MADPTTEIRQLGAVLNEVPIVACHLGTDLSFRECNQAALQLVGAESRDQLVGHRLGDWHRNPWIVDHAWDAIRNDRACAELVDLHPMNGLPPRQLILSYLPEHDESRGVSGLYLEGVDVTDLVDDGRTAGFERSQFSLLISELLGGIVVASALTGEPLVENERAREILSLDEMSRVNDGRGDVVVTRLDGTLIARDDLALIRTMRDGQIVRGEEIVVRRPSGDSTIVSISTAPLFDASGSIVAGVGIYLDVTTHRRAEERTERAHAALERRLSQSDEQLRAAKDERERAEVRRREVRALLASVLDSATIGIAISDVSGRITEANEALGTMLGVPPEELAGRRLSSFVFLEDADAEAQHFEELAHGEVEHYRLQTRYVREDGQVLWGKLSVSLAHAGDPDHAIIQILEDGTEERAAFEALQDRDLAIRRAYADVVSAVTGGRLVLIAPDEVDQLLGDAIGAPIVVREAKDLPGMRADLKRRLADAFPRLTDLYGLVLAAGEAATNAVKHAGGGTVDVRRTAEGAQVIVRDGGPGIDFRNLPHATLAPGFSTTGTLGVGFSIMLDVCERVLLATSPVETAVILEMAEQPD